MLFFILQVQITSRFWFPRFNRQNLTIQNNVLLTRHTCLSNSFRCNQSWASELPQRGSFGWLSLHQNWGTLLLMQKLALLSVARSTKFSGTPSVAYREDWKAAWPRPKRMQSKIGSLCIKQLSCQYLHKRGLFLRIDFTYFFENSLALSLLFFHKEKIFSWNHQNDSTEEEWPQDLEQVLKWKICYQ